MTTQTQELAPRAERLMPKAGLDIQVFVGKKRPRFIGCVANISRTGLCLRDVEVNDRDVARGDLSAIQLVVGRERLSCGDAEVIRVSPSHPPANDVVTTVALAFHMDQTQVVHALHPALRSDDYVSTELAEDDQDGVEQRMDATDFTTGNFYAKPSRDLLAKCAAFRPWIDDLQRRQVYQSMYRITATGPIDHHMTVFDPIRRAERTVICFDSNSYLGLHLHPKVIERTQEVLQRVGYGTASAQLLSGTNRYLRELEVDLSAHLGREDTMIFPTGYAANLGAIGALIRKNDAVLRDQLAHASIQDGCKAAPAKFNRVYKHNDMASLEQMLIDADAEGCDGKLIATDGVYSMHGRVAPLREMVDLADRYGAHLLIDEAHSIGVLGATGGGIEEELGLQGRIGILMGTLSKAFGAVGGYVSGSRDLITYLRWFANAGMFTTALPAATCAGLREALRVMREEPEHRERLWHNIRRFSPALREAGFIVPDAVSPITTVFLGSHTLMMEVSRDLFAAGIKCGSVMFPAVAKGEAVLRLTVNARHTDEDIERTVEVLTALGQKWGILHRTEEEIRAIGARVRLGDGDHVQRKLNTHSAAPVARQLV